jgi:glutaredoxin
MAKKILMIGLSTCPACNELDKRLKERNITYITRLDIDKDALAREIAMRLKLQSVPQLVIYSEEEKKACLIKFKENKPSIERCVSLQDFAHVS